LNNFRPCASRDDRGRDSFLPSGYPDFLCDQKRSDCSLCSFASA
jgi:hypothetical protein